MSIGIAARRLEGTARSPAPPAIRPITARKRPPCRHRRRAGRSRDGRRESTSTAPGRCPGVVRVLTATDMPRFGQIGPPAAVLNLPMQDDRIRHEGEPVALVLAESIEAAEAACAAVEVHCRPERTGRSGQGPA